MMQEVKAIFVVHKNLVDHHEDSRGTRVYHIIQALTLMCLRRFSLLFQAHGCCDLFGVTELVFYHGRP